MESKGEDMKKAFIFVIVIFSCSIVSSAVFETGNRLLSQMQGQLSPDQHSSRVRGISCNVLWP